MQIENFIHVQTRPLKDSLKFWILVNRKTIYILYKKSIAETFEKQMIDITFLLSQQQKQPFNKVINILYSIYFKALRNDY